MGAFIMTTQQMTKAVNYGIASPLLRLMGHYRQDPISNVKLG